MFLEGAAATSPKNSRSIYAMYSTIHGRIRRFIDRRSKDRTDFNSFLLNDEALAKVKSYALTLREEGEPMNEEGAAPRI